MWTEWNVKGPSGYYPFGRGFRLQRWRRWWTALRDRFNMFGRGCERNQNGDPRKTGTRETMDLVQRATNGCNLRRSRMRFRLSLSHPFSVQQEELWTKYIPSRVLSLCFALLMIHGNYMHGRTACKNKKPFLTPSLNMGTFTETASVCCYCSFSNLFLLLLLLCLCYISTVPFRLLSKSKIISPTSVVRNLICCTNMKHLYCIMCKKHRGARLYMVVVRAAEWEFWPLFILERFCFTYFTIFS